jgi:hypothetical protein
MNDEEFEEFLGNFWFIVKEKFEKQKFTPKQINLY